MKTYSFKVHLKVMLAPANYSLFVCLQARKKVAQYTFKKPIFKKI